MKQAVGDGVDCLSVLKKNEETLRHQSRSFAIPILALDQPLRSSVILHYNLNKTLDTIEDHLDLSVDEKIHYLNLFCLHLNEPGEPGESGKNLVTMIQAMRQLAEKTACDQAYVFNHYPYTMRLYAMQTIEERALHRDWTCEMAKGMCLFLKKPIETWACLDEYCYYVAGTVGCYLTQLLRLHTSDLQESKYQALMAHAVGFGRFIQKLNVIRDYQEDLRDKSRSYWPSALNPNLDPLYALNQLCAHVIHQDLPHAILYWQALPYHQVKFDQFVRYILGTGVTYLARLSNNQDVVFGPQKVKLSKAMIEKSYAYFSGLSKDDFLKYCRNSSAPT